MNEKRLTSTHNLNEKENQKKGEKTHLHTQSECTADGQSKVLEVRRRP